MYHPNTSSETKIRLTAFFVLALTLMYLLTGQGLIPLFLLLDFGLRAFNLSRYSPLGNLSYLLVRALHLPEKPVYMPPKRFAARIGFAFFVAIVILHFTTLPAAGTPPATAALAGRTSLFADSLAATTHAPLAATIPAAVIVLFAALESLVNFCAGCYVYTFLVRLRGH